MRLATKLVIAVPIATFLLFLLLVAGITSGIFGGPRPSHDAMTDIPPDYLSLYQAAADTCPGLPWTVLAAIGKVESDHGRSQLPGVRSGANAAGAAGPMQIGIGGKAGPTFQHYGVDIDGGGASPYSPADAIYTAARYLCEHGGGKDGDLYRAIFAYNHADWYVDKVLAIASSYAATVTLPPSAPAHEQVQAAIEFAYSQLGTPYKWGATGEGFYDCSGLMLKAYERAGIRLPRTSREQWHAGARVSRFEDLAPGDLVFFAYDRTDPTTIHHVGLYIGAGNMIDAPHKGASVRVTTAMRPDFIGGVRPTAQPQPAR